ncbi:MAG: hypothetical protein PHU63_04110, partial [Candidatus ainarchaeum sp.]|nr:hypothetical protein [Candidatus ainarchaeum sp.]
LDNIPIQLLVNAINLRNYGSNILGGKTTGFPQEYLDEVSDSTKAALMVVDFFRENPEYLPVSVFEAMKVAEILFRSEGKEFVERAKRETPISLPEGYRLWKQLPAIRREMTIQRKRRNPEWRKVRV